MNWLDLGWLKRGESWEFHPWGPFSRGYLLPAGAEGAARRRVRWIRLSVLLAAGVALALKFTWHSWWPVVAIGLVGGLIEGLATWKVVAKLGRTEEALGWERGMQYLAQWLAPNLLGVARWLAVGMLGFGLWLCVREPKALGPYLLVGSMVGSLYLILYLQQAQKGR